MPKQDPNKLLESINKTGTAAEAKVASLLSHYAQANKSWLTEEVKAEQLARLEGIKVLLDSATTLLAKTSVPKVIVAAEEPETVAQAVSNGSGVSAVEAAAPSA